MTSQNNQQISLQIQNNIQEIIQILQGSSSQNYNNASLENYFLERRANPDHIMAMLEALKRPNIPKEISIFISIELKNLVKTQFKMLSESRQALENHFLDHFKIKLIEFYFDTTYYLNNKKNHILISDTVKFLIRNDFPHHWPDLIDLICANFSHQEHYVNLLSVKLLKHITKNYPYQILSDDKKLEIQEVVGKSHDLIMQFCQGYVNTLGEGFIPLDLSMTIISSIFRIFSNFLANEVGEVIEEQIVNWMKIIEPVFAPELNSKIENMIQVHCNNGNSNSDELSEKWFECKGEAVKIISSATNKYQQDISEEVDKFAEIIWQNCQKYANSDQKNKNKLLVNSMKYFKSMASSQKYFAFFEQNVKEIIVKLIIPVLTSISDDSNSFKNESESFAESMFVGQNVDSKKNIVIHDFVITLVRFYRDNVFSVIESMLNELLNARSLDTIFNEIIFLHIFSTSVMTQQGENGATVIVCPLEFMIFVYENLVEGILNSFIDNWQNFDKPSLNQMTFLVCYFLRFLFFFQSFIGYSKTSEIIFKLYVKTLAIPCLSYQLMLIELLNQILKKKSFKLEDNMNKSVANMSFYQRYYNNPQKVQIRFNDSSLCFNFNENNKIFGELCSTTCQYFSSTVGDLNPRTVRLIRQLVSLIDGVYWESYEATFYNLIMFGLENMINKKIKLNFLVINPFFEFIVDVMTRQSSHGFENASRTLGLMPKLLSTQSLEMNALVFQIVAIYIRLYSIDISVASAPHFSSIWKMVLSVNNYNKNNIGILFSYFILIQETVLVNPDVLKTQQNFLVDILKANNAMLQIHNTFNFLKFLSSKKLPLTEYLFISVSSLEEFNNIINSQNNEVAKFVFMKQSIIQDFYEFILIESVQNSFENLIWMFKNKNLVDHIRMILVEEECLTFLSHTISRAFRIFMLIVFAKILFTEYEFFVKSGFSIEFTSILNACLENIWKMRFDSKSMKSTYEGRMLEQKNFDEMTDLNFSNIHRLKVFSEVTGEFIDEFRKTVNINQSADMFFIEMFKQFLERNQLKAENVVQNNKYMTLLK